MKTKAEYAPIRGRVSFFSITLSGAVLACDSNAGALGAATTDGVGIFARTAGRAGRLAICGAGPPEQATTPAARLAV